MTSFFSIAWAQAGSGAVSRVIRYSGTLKNVDGSPRSGTLGVTFAIYQQQDSSAPLYQEVQNVAVDPDGHYSVLLGGARPEGLPSELFTTYEARWLGIRVENEPEQPRILLAAVPYALKAADAETLGGKPLSAFVLAAPERGPGEAGGATASGSGSAQSNIGPHPNSISGSTGTPGQLAVWTDSSTLGPADFSDVGGYLGIGTATPQSALHIFSSAAPVVRIERSNGTANTVMNFVWNGVNKADFGVPGVDGNFVNGSLAGDFALRNFGGNMLFSTDSGAHAQLYLKQGGNVGIGTTMPGQALDVAGNINASGNVAATGTISGSNLSATGTATFSGIPTGTGVGSGALYINPGAANAGQTLFGIAVGGSQRLLADSAGNLSAAGALSGSSVFLPATTSAFSGVMNLGGQSFLHGFPGGTSASTFVGRSAGNFSLSGTGNTGVGSSAMATVSTGNSNTAVGANALLNTTAGAANTSVGYNALASNVTGVNNTAIGTSTLYSNTASGNTAVGVSSMQSNTSGTGSSALGFYAMFANTTGANNTAVGSQALQSSTTASNNTALGAFALNLSVTGGWNTAIGAHTLQKYASNYSTAVGYGALQNSVASGNNTALGAFAANVNTSGIGNTVVGLSALSSNTTGSFNTAVGGVALASNVGGSNNIAIGDDAGYYSTGSNNIYIGHQGVAAENNTIRIGDDSTQTTTYISGVLHGDGSGLTNVNASGLATVPSAVVNLRVITYIAGCPNCGLLTASDSDTVIYQNLLGSPLTFLSITCYSDGGTPAIDLQRDNGTQANITSNSIGCSTAGNTVSTFSVAALNANEKLNFLMTSPDGVAHRVTVILKTTL